MQSAISWLSVIKPRQIFTLIMVQIVLWLGFSFLPIYSSHAWAASTPEATSYQVDKTADDVEVNTKVVGEKASKAVKDTKENLVEKLNLDEPLPPETKKFFRQIQGKEPIDNSNNR